MHRVQIYFLLFLLTAILTPTIFYWENDCQFIGMSEKLIGQPYAFHWVPEVLCLLFLGMWVTCSALSISDTFPNIKTTIKYLLLISTVSFGLIVLSVDILLFRDEKPVYFIGFLWGVPVLSGYMLELLIQKRKTRK